MNKLKKGLITLTAIVGFMGLSACEKIIHYDYKINNYVCKVSVPLNQFQLFENGELVGKRKYFKPNYLKDNSYLKYTLPHDSISIILESDNKEKIVNA
ncbi:MAG: hypothetical protein KKB39_05940 [Nanoarchaeota archaeon]|nr:hypothetical protein [Nanoarchaeota archaeon]